MIYIATKNLLQALAKFPQAPLNLGLGRNSLPSTINFIYPRLVNEARNIFYFRSINLTIYKDFQTFINNNQKDWHTQDKSNIYTRREGGQLIALSEIDKNDEYVYLLEESQKVEMNYGKGYATIPFIVSMGNLSNFKMVNELLLKIETDYLASQNPKAYRKTVEYPALYQLKTIHIKNKRDYRKANFIKRLEALNIDEHTKDRILEEIREYMEQRYAEGIYTVRQLQSIDFVDEATLPVLSRFYKNPSILKLQERDGFVMFQKPSTTNTDYRRIAIKRIDIDNNNIPIFIIVKDNYNTKYNR